MNWGIFLDAFPGTLLGAVFSGVTWLIIRFGSWFTDRLPINRLLAPYRHPDQQCTIFCRLMRPEGKLHSMVPQYYPQQPTGVTDQWINIPHVVSAADMQAVTDVVGVLGRAGRVQNIEFASAESEWDRWNTPMIFSGGNRKLYELFESTPHPPIRFDAGKGAFRVANSTYQAVDGRDYAVVWKTRYPPTGHYCLVLFGLGSLGTEAAARFFRSNAKLLGQLFGDRGFAILLRVSLKQGKESAVPIWTSAIAWSFKVRHPLQWRRNVSNWKTVESGSPLDGHPGISGPLSNVLSSTNAPDAQRSVGSSWPPSTTTLPGGGNRQGRPAD